MFRERSTPRLIRFWSSLFSLSCSTALIIPIRTLLAPPRYNFRCVTARKGRGRREGSAGDITRNAIFLERSEWYPYELFPGSGSGFSQNSRPSDSVCRTRAVYNVVTVARYPRGPLETPFITACAGCAATATGPRVCTVGPRRGFFQTVANH